MSRTVSTNFRSALMSQEAVSTDGVSQVFLMLLTITDDSLVEPIRVVNNRTDISSGGYTYTGFPFRIDLSQDSPDELPEATLTLDNCARELTLAVRAITGIPAATLAVVLASTPDALEVGPLPFNMRRISVNASTIQATLGGEDILNQKYPKDAMTPQNFPGLF